MIDFPEWLRLLNAGLGVVGVGLLMFRLIGRWDDTRPLAKAVVALLAGAVLVMALGSAEALRLDSPFNWVGWLALGVNVATVAVGLMWHKALQADGRL